MAVFPVGVRRRFGGRGTSLLEPLAGLTPGQGSEADAMTERCEQCGRAFPTRSAAAAHAQTSHAPGWIVTGVVARTEPIEEEVICPLCGERQPSKESLARHSLRPHYRSNRSVRRTPNYSIG
jgi:hypothetical protein